MHREGGVKKAIMNFTKEWALEQVEKRKAERGYDWFRDQEIPDPGLESELQRKVLNLGKENGWAIFHDRSRKMNDPGWGDNFIFLPDHKIVLIELKSETGRLSKEQKDLRLILNYLGHPVYMARSYKRVLEIINEELKEG